VYTLLFSDETERHHTCVVCLDWSSIVLIQQGLFVPLSSVLLSANQQYIPYCYFDETEGHPRYVVCMGKH